MAASRSRVHSGTELLVFGYAAADASLDAKRHMTDLAVLLGKLAGIDVSVTALPSYERVTQLVHKREIDLAWLPPIPFVSLLRNDRVVPLVCPYRGATHYHSALLVPIGAKHRSPARLAGLRAAWVDKYSAAGFVLPRVQFAAMGVDPRTAFPEERFYGSHAGVVRAIAEGTADFGATYVRLGKKGEVVSGPWSLSPTLATSVRVLTTFGEIPADVIAARADLAAPVRDRVVAAFVRLIQEPIGRDLVRRVFGADDFRRPSLASYELLRNVVVDALEEGLLEIEAEMDPNAPTLPRAPRPARSRTR